MGIPSLHDLELVGHDGRERWQDGQGRLDAYDGLDAPGRHPLRDHPAAPAPPAAILSRLRQGVFLLAPPPPPPSEGAAADTLGTRAM